MGMDRRHMFLLGAATISFSTFGLTNNRRAKAGSSSEFDRAAFGTENDNGSKKEASSVRNPDPSTIPDFDKWQLSDDEWRERLSPEAYNVLRKEGTERAFTSPLNDEKRKGVYACAGCGLPLFSSEKKFNSGTGWPSFFDVLPNAVGTKTDFKILYPRTEYHCARCGGHQGHVFKDGPEPTGLRYCNNGVALVFKPAENDA